MKCNACNYDSDLNKEESDWMFWEMSNVNFEFERQEFTDEKEVMNGSLYVCPKCYNMQIVPKEKKFTNLDEEE